MDISKSAFSNISGSYKWITIGLALALARVPFAMTHHFQEDTFIIFRTAFNLADHGQFTFNIDESTSGATSILYAFIVASLRILCGTFAINAVTITNTIIAVTSAWLLARSLEPERNHLLLWAAISLLPVSLLVSYVGMDTALLLGMISLGVYGIAFHRESSALPFSTLLLPLVRPDAIGFASIFVAACFLINRSRAIQAAIFLAFGIATVAGFNFIESGSPITATALAKEISYSPDRSLIAVIERIFSIFWIDSYLIPVSSKYLIVLSPIASVISIAMSGFALRSVWNAPVRRSVIFALIGAAYGIPIVYAYGGVIASWYLWPSAWIAHSIALFILLRWINHIAEPSRIAAGICIVSGFILCGLIQWMVSYNDGVQEFDYRAGVGRYIASVAQPTDTLFLEPAGFIPFFSGLKTWDEIGLVSSDILSTKMAHPINWWPIFVKEKRPTWIVQRPDLVDNGMTYQGYSLTPDEREWLFSHYKVVRRFTYVSSNYTKSWVGKRILSLGQHSGYDVLKLVEPVASEP